ncbi:hypothetical protein MKEN_01361200 [Mycena kentingensis (nom. inval.)]|nr:hypothetical protein MKEN_01361200 [Mycena kentingensis (nom. inval.)]
MAPALALISRPGGGSAFDINLDAVPQAASELGFEKAKRGVYTASAAPATVFGVTVGIVLLVGGVLLACIVYFVLRRRRKRANSKAPSKLVISNPILLHPQEEKARVLDPRKSLRTTSSFSTYSTQRVPSTPPTKRPPLPPYSPEDKVEIPLIIETSRFSDASDIPTSSFLARGSRTASSFLNMKSTRGSTAQVRSPPISPPEKARQHTGRAWPARPGPYAQVPEDVGGWSDEPRSMSYDDSLNPIAQARCSFARAPSRSRRPSNLRTVTGPAASPSRPRPGKL